MTVETENATRTLTLGYSPCPNDTFIFHALVSGLVGADGLAFAERLEDVETLNRLAGDAALDVTKVSYGAIPHLLRDYVLLRSGGALGRGCGPLVVAREGFDASGLAGARIAIPGRNTTANLLLRLFAPGAPAGIERATGLPIPLGGILARRDLGEETIRAVDDAIRRSVEHAFAHPPDWKDYVRAHAQEMDEAVQRQHIDLYVNRFTVDLGDEGERAVHELFARARAAGIIAEDVASPFL
jgi:1,4-dihydroxy-6-naphthoate synthase